MKHLVVEEVVDVCFQCCCAYLVESTIIVKGDVVALE